ncbi:putative group 3/4 sigma-70 RNA polymerase sigma factor [Nostoc sp. NIES-4103]|nr:putative group 3/4 sigma-70 RNA polymerase sigma factor [Nostoc sp. NIES-4103]
MLPRQEIVEIFSSFLQFSSGDSTKWVSDSALSQNMRRYLTQSALPERSNIAWALYWHSIWQNQPKSLARGHLYAYLQEVGHKAANKMKPRFRLPQYTLGDYFQIAIASVDKVLKGFDPVRNSNLEVYAYYKLCNLIKDGLIKEGLEEANVRSDWSLLQNSSEKQIYKSLQQRGLSVAEIERYIFAWECFKLVYVPKKPRGNRQLDAPDSTTWDAIAQLYNQERLTQLPQSEPLNAATIQKLMTVCITAIRAYMAPPTASLDASVFNEDNTLQDILPSSDTTSLAQLIDDEEAQNRRSLLQQINSLLSNAITHLDAQTKELFEMYYGEGFTQKEIASQLQISQPTVSRRLAKLHNLKNEWLLTLAKWTQATLNISLTPDVINSMSGLLDEWLEQHYGKNNDV